MNYPRNTVAAAMSQRMANAVKVSDIWGGIIVNVKESPYLAKGDGVTDDTAAIQAAIDAVEDGVIVFPDTGSSYRISTIKIYRKGSETSSLSLVFQGRGLASTVGAGNVAVDIQSCKRLYIQGLILTGGDTAIKGLWDSNFKNCQLHNTAFGGTTSDVSNYFSEHYWNHFERVRFGELSFALRTDSEQHYTNQNTFISCIAEGVAITGNDTGQFQGNAWISGELRQNFTVDTACSNLVPNGLTILSTYLDQSNTEVDLYNFEISQLGISPEVNGFSLDGQKLSASGSTQQLSQYGPKSGRRIPASGVNFIKNGDLSEYMAGETIGTEPIRYNTTVEIVAGDGLSGKFFRGTGTGSFGTVGFRSVALPLPGTYTATAIFRRPSAGSYNVRFKKNSTEAYGVLGQESPIKDEWIIGSYTFKADAGDIATIEFYLVAAYSGTVIDVAYCGVSLGGHGLICLPTAEAAKNQNKVRWRSAAPTTGTWAVGDIIYNTAPTAGGKIGWVCVTADPLTWKTFGAIDS